MKPIKIPNICLKWIKLQRSGYKDIKKEFNENMLKEYKIMKPYLPEKCKKICDIGCGLAGFDVLLTRHYNNPLMYLIDSSESNQKVFYGFNPDGTAFYNSFFATQQLLTENKVFSYRIIDVARDNLPILENIDLVISLLSCGYHYSVDKYLGYIYNMMNKDARFILDTRENTDEIDKLKKRFENVEIISDYNKSNRVVCWGKK